ncbi:glycosyltransferase [Actinomyces sp. 2119]|uniref:Glycosyltransferase n=1 Tax=Actinomyces lilanjuaniae TaxID=2321394 RepID=A0ABM6Z4W0_9ACTO|nr:MULTISPECIES: glycosyltransferase [Actinomyces]AYD90250.1 glycosyltransferase [Actinomyces lilanjuaniae]RJF41514.1 glycosyltransferase [Actinomyces sp. 2119]
MGCEETPGADRSGERSQKSSQRISQRIVVATLDTLGEKMAGPAIRAWEISSHLAAQGHRVRLLTFAACQRQGAGFQAARTDVDGFRREVEGADVVVIQGYIAATFPWLHEVPQKIVIDLYDPFHLESLEAERYQPLDQRDAALSRALLELDAQVLRGDFFICASEKQRDLWLGHLAGSGRVNPLTYDADPSLRSLIDVVAFGTSDDEAVQTRHPVKGTVPGIGAEDPVVIWGGGVYNWFDPLSVVRAIDVVRRQVPDVRLFFLGMRHPNPDVPEMDMAVRTRQEADRLGLTGTTVFFHEDWVAYEDRVNYLMDADVGVSTHFDHIETAFSFRTRILDYLWAGLPIVCSAGDSFATLVERDGLGASVPVGDTDALASSIITLLSDDTAARSAREAVRGTARELTWQRTLQPLIRYCAQPYRAADHERVAAYRPAGQVSLLTALRRDLRAVSRTLRTSGARGVAAKVQWRLSRLRR